MVSYHTVLMTIMINSIFSSTIIGKRENLQGHWLFNNSSSHEFERYYKVIQIQIT